LSNKDQSILLGGGDNFSLKSRDVIYGRPHITPLKQQKSFG